MKGRHLIYFCFLITVIFSCKENSNLRLENGYEYKILTDISGSLPNATDVVMMDFEIIDVFGNTLDDSREANVRPTFQIPESRTSELNKNPLLSLIEIMSPGDSAEVYVPIDSLPNPPQEFKQSPMITYRVKMISVEDVISFNKRIKKENEDHLKLMNLLGAEVKNEAERSIEYFNNGSLKGRLVEKNQGMKVMVTNEGAGNKASYGDQVSVHYFGFFKDGTSFDNSYKAGKPFTFVLGKGGAIEGMMIGAAEVGEGGSAILDIPSGLAYGSAGNPPLIPPDADLVFYIKIDKVSKPQAKPRTK